MDSGESSYRRFLEGDESAFDEIVDMLFFKLVFFVNGYVHDVHAAEDIATDAISELFANKKRYNFKVSLKTYVFMIGKSKALNYIKRKKLISTVSFCDSEPTDSDEKLLEDTVLESEKKRIVHKALGQLKGELQTVLHLVYFEEMSIEEAAKVMNKSKKQVYNLIYRAKNEMRIALAKEGITDEGYI